MKLNAFGTNYAVGEGVNTRRLVNCYLEMLEGGGDGDNGFIVRPTAGASLLPSPGPNGGLIVQVYPVNEYYCYTCWQGTGSTYYLTKVLINTPEKRVLDSSYAHVSLTAPNTLYQNAKLQIFGNNNTQLLIGYQGSPLDQLLYAHKIDTATNAITPVTSLLIAGMQPKTGVYINDRWVIISTNGNIYYSDLSSPVFSAINFFTTAKGTTPAEMAIINNNQLMIITNSSYEIWAPSENADEPFIKINNLTGHIGSALFLYRRNIEGASTEEEATTFLPSNKLINGEVYWIGADKNNEHAVYCFSGGQAQRISDEYIESKIQVIYSHPYKTYSFSKGSNHFYAIEMNGYKFIYNIKTGKWHETTQSMPNGFLYIEGGRFCNYDYNSADNVYGSPIERSIEFEPIYDPNDFNKMFHHSLRVKTSGTINTGTKYSQVLTLKISNDGGKTFPITRTSTRNVDGFNQFNMLGSAKKRVYRLEWNNPGYFPMTGITSPNMRIGSK
jgi:hypothetical protein